MPDVDPKCPKCQITLGVKLTEFEFYNAETDGTDVLKVGAIIVSCANCGHIIGCVSTTSN